MRFQNIRENKFARSVYTGIYVYRVLGMREGHTYIIIGSEQSAKVFRYAVIINFCIKLEM